ncbi:MULTISPECIES: DegQ family serine endoprotease [Methylococcus]|uniref:Probable periplasmic serine endoprotease DegP-like n=1 Tax=Methylococcus capsulatus TaxID=414 RepID=A0ABZ2F4Y3_METCP|nr:MULTISPECIES: DegQ family serine endoprotease [Methylococcus]MDF9391596.1 DegQ family serine endoprotease [Methylococcus capsulatus]
MFDRYRFVGAICAALVLAVSPAVRAQLPDFTQLVEQNNAAVVNISTTQKVAANEQQMPEGLEIPEGTPFDDFFRHYFGEGGSDGQPSEAKSLGSGFIMSTDGYIITNHHVVKGADEIVVRLQDRRELVAKIVGSDKRSDVALLKIEATQLPTVKLGSSEKLKVGEWVLAIGSPFGFDHSATAGIVSAKGRSLPSDNYVPFIQTDVAINPGNSGGPLFNLNGEVVGVNSQIYSRTGGFMGLSFAIPIEVAMQVVDQLKASGRVSRGWLGVQIQDVTRELAESFGMKKPQGALVSKVLPKSPAEAAGIQIGDIVLEFNGQAVDTSAALPPMVGMTKVGEVAKIKLLRNGTIKELTIKIGSLPDEEEPAMGTGEPNAVPLKRMGASVADLTPELREQFEVPRGGVLVYGVNPGPAYDAGLRRGDVILRIQDKEINSVKQLLELEKTLPAGKSLAVLVQRRDGSIFLAMKLKDEKQ